MSFAASQDSLVRVEAYAIRTYGDPVLRSAAKDIANIDSKLLAVCDHMHEAMVTAQGIGLAAPQVGIQQRFFVYDIEAVNDLEGTEGAVRRVSRKKSKSAEESRMGVLINPVITEAEGEWAYEEACLSVPNLSWDIIRPKTIHVSGFDIDGNEVEFEADELFSRLIQHEIDHLDGVLLIDRLDEDTRKAARRTLRERLSRERLPR